MFKRSYLFAVSIISIFLSFSFAQAKDETLTITTYYPSPYGVYNELRAKKMAIGDNYIKSSYQWGSAIDANADLVVEGNVGIGTPKPQARLHVVGPDGLVRLSNTEDNNTDKAGRLVVSHYANSEEPVYVAGGYAESGRNYVAIGGGENIGNAATQIDLFTAVNTTTPVGTTRMRITGDGNVGIGTTAPTAKLHVNGTIVGTDTCTSAGNCLGKVSVFFTRMDGASTGDEACAAKGGMCVSAGYGADQYAFCGTNIADPSNTSSGAHCLKFN